MEISKNENVSEDKVKKIKDPRSFTDGKKIVKIAIQEPFNKILTNAGHDDYDISFNSLLLNSF